MKKIFRTMMLALACYTLPSCNNEEDPTGNTGITDNQGAIIEDVRFLGHQYCYTMDDVDFYLYRKYPYFYVNQTRESHKDFYDNAAMEAGEHRPLAYDNMVILYHSLRPTLENPTEKDYPSQKELHFLDSISQLISPDMETHQALMEERERFIFATLGNEAHFLTARIQGNVTITADKTLFNLPAGTDLSQHFCTEGPSLCLPQGSITDFRMIFNYGDKERPTSPREFFAKDTWLQRCYAFRMKDIPDEQYGQVTFTIRIPIEKDNWWDFFYNDLTELQSEPYTIGVSCTVNFGNISSFYEDYGRLIGENTATLWWM